MRKNLHGFFRKILFANSFILFAVGLFSSSWCGATITDVISNNNQGIEHLKKQNFAKAQEHLNKAMSEAPFQSELQLNLGLTFDGMGQPEKALQSYQQTEKVSKDEKLLFAAAFNQAEILGRQKKIPEALAMYQKALQYRPDSVEAKTNIELLTQQQSGGQNQQQQQQGKEGENQDGQDKNQAKDQDQDQDNEQNKDPEKNQNKPKNYSQGKPQPKNFQSPEISKDDARKILDELDRQEQRVRAEYNKKQRKEKSNGQDW